MGTRYECADVIVDLQFDMMMFGENYPAWGVWKVINKIPVLVNYLLGDDEPTVSQLDGKYALRSTLRKLLPILEEQNSALEI